MSLGNLNIRIGSAIGGAMAGIGTVKSGLGKLRDGINDNTRALGRYLKVAVSVGSALAGWKLLRTAREFDLLNAQLRTATGSMEGAGRASEAIRDFAATTPYDLQQVTTAFTKLVNLGLTPSERALTSYGNTASAMGKSLDQMIEAVADAATGEFERLKEFGIKASTQGDQIAFRFRGITTTVKNNAEAIEGYLMALGENEFAGAMAQRMDSLDGELSNLEDSWTNLFQTINEAGIGDLMRDGVAIATQAVQQLTDLIASGALVQAFKGYGPVFDGFVSDISSSLSTVAQLFDSFAGTDFDLGGAIADMPSNIRAFIKIMTVEVAAFIDKTAAWGQEILENLQFWKDEEFDLEKELQRLNGIREESIDVIMRERDAELQARDSALQKADEMLAKFQAIKAAREEAAIGTDRLEGFRVGGEAGEDTSGEDKAFAKRLERLRSEFETEMEVKREQQAQIADLNRAFEYGEIETRAEYEAIRQQIIQESEDKILAIKQRGMTALERFQAMSFKNQTKTVLGQLETISAGVAQHSRAMFELNKGAGIANAIISAYEGIALTLKTYPYPWNLGMAALHGVAAFAQVNAIRSTSFNGGGGGSAPSIAGSTPATPVSNVGGTGDSGGGGASGGTFTLLGFDRNRAYDYEELRGLFGAIQEHVNNGGRVRLVDA